MIGDILQPTHLLFILVIALLVLGPKRLPEVGRSLGRGLRDFRQAMSGLEDDDRVEVEPAAAQTTAPAAQTTAPAANTTASAAPEPVATAPTGPAEHSD